MAGRGTIILSNMPDRQQMQINVSLRGGAGKQRLRLLVGNFSQEYSINLPYFSECTWPLRKYML